LTTTSKENRNLILISNKNNFRSIIKKGGKEELQKQMQLNILILANCYTSANFNNPLTKTEKLTLNACSNTVINQFPELGMKELDLAFQLASSGKLDNVPLKVFYGKFHVGIIGQVLKAYKKFRHKVIVNSEEIKKAEIKKLKSINDAPKILIKNTLARIDIVNDYFLLKADICNSSLDEIYSKIKSNWITTLIDNEIVNFNSVEKKDIWLQSKKNVVKKLNNILFNNNSTKIQKTESKEILRKIKHSKYSEKLEQKNIQEYSKQLILKTLLL
jgi:hypothetical protein